MPGVVPGDGPGDMIVRLDQVTKSFGPKLALNAISAGFPRGRICGLLGPNGAGKTTLFRLLMGILKPTSGTLRVDRRDAFADRVALKQLIGFLPDEPVFYSYLTGREILAFSAAMHGLDAKAALDRLAPAIEKMRMTQEIHNYAEDYSRGMKKKLGLLLAILHEPRLLILDEPTNGLDVEATRIFYDLMQQQVAQGVSILFSSHLMDQVTKLCSHLIVIRHGMLVAQGTLDDLRATNPAASLEDIFLTLTA